MAFSYFADNPLFALLAGVGILAFLFLVTRLVFSFLGKRAKSFSPAACSFFMNTKSAAGGVLAILTLMAFTSQTPFEEGLLTTILLWERVVFIAVLAWFFIRLVYVLQEVTFKRFSIDKENNLRARKVRTQFQYIKTILVIIIVVVALAFLLRQFNALKGLGTGLLASAGVAGIIIGFAAQRTLGDLLAGMQIAFTQPLRIDDAVIVEDEWGWVEEITLTYVVIKIWDERRLVLPITYFVEKPFQNWTRNSGDIIGSVYVYADYAVDVPAVRKEVERLVKKNKRWDKRVCVLQVTKFTEKTVELRALMSAKSSPAAWDLRCEVREGLLAYFQKKHPEALPRIRLEDGFPRKTSSARAKK